MKTIEIDEFDFTASQTLDLIDNLNKFYNNVVGSLILRDPQQKKIRIVINEDNVRLDDSTIAEVLSDNQHFELKYIR